MPSLAILTSNADGRSMTVIVSIAYPLVWVRWTGHNRIPPGRRGHDYPLPVLPSLRVAYPCRGERLSWPPTPLPSSARLSRRTVRAYLREDATLPPLLTPGHTAVRCLLLLIVLTPVIVGSSLPTPLPSFFAVALENVAAGPAPFVHASSIAFPEVHSFHPFQFGEDGTIRFVNIERQCPPVILAGTPVEVSLPEVGNPRVAPLKLAGMTDDLLPLAPLLGRGLAGVLAHVSRSLVKRPNAVRLSGLLDCLLDLATC